MFLVAYAYKNEEGDVCDDVSEFDNEAAARAFFETCRPFAVAAADADDGSVRGSATAWESPMAMAVTYGDFRRARAALSRASAQKEAGNG